MRKAFTMLELVFVIVVAGILAAVIIPRTDSTATAEAAIQLESHIRYAQHLAMVDDKFDSTDANWFKKRWQIAFNGNAYSIASDNGATFAVNPQNSDQNLSSINLNDDYGVTLSFNGSCAADDDISFDHLGRPMVGDLNDAAFNQSYVGGYLMTADCIITLTGSDGTNQTLTIRPETGYVSRTN